MKVSTRDRYLMLDSNSPLTGGQTHTHTHNEILQFCLNLKSGALPWSLYIAGNKQAYKWAAKYDAVLLEDKSAVLVLRPTKGQHVDAQSICLSGFQSIRLSALQQPTYVE